MNRIGAVVKGLLAAGFVFAAVISHDVASRGAMASLLAIAALLGYFGWRDWRRPKVVPAETPAAGQPPRMRTTFVNCGVILALDVLFLGAPALAVYAGLALLLWLIPRIFLAWRRPELRRHRSIVALVTAGVLAVDGGAYWISETLAEKRVVAVADALARYQARNGAYPRQLQTLVPDYLPTTPSAKPGLVLMGGIIYLHNEGKPALMYVSFPPFGRRVLNVETREWSFMD